MPSRSRRLHLRQPLNRSEEPYAGVGSILCEARKKSNQSLEAVAQRLHIRLSHLKAIEEGRFNDLPGSAYAIGFVRSYAEHLSLNGEDLAKKFKVETSTKIDGNELRFPIPHSRGRLPGGRVLVISAVLVVMVYGLWFYISESGQMPIQLVGSVPDHLAVNEGFRPDMEEMASNNEIEGAPQEKYSMISPKNAGNQRLIKIPESSKDEETDQIPQPEIQNSSVAELTLSQHDTHAQTVSGSDVSNSRIIITAHTDTWVQISDLHDVMLLSRVLHAGEKFYVPDQPDLFLMTGNAGAIQIIVDGKAIAPLGSAGVVRRGVVLDPMSLLAVEPGR